MTKRQTDAPIEVQKGIPLPAAIRRGAPPAKYPFSKMGIGEFFFVPHRAKNNITTLSNRAARKLQRVFRTRMMYMEKSTGQWEPCAESADGAVLGIGVFRIE